MGFEAAENFASCLVVTRLNARQARALVKREGSLAAFIWRYEPGVNDLAQPQTASISAASVALSKELKRQGWKFVGPTTVYAFMQAMGLINDHAENCVIRAKTETARKRFQSQVAAHSAKWQKE